MSNHLKNPWLKLPSEPPYILKEDIEVINKFNKNVSVEYKIFKNCLAEPFSGNPFKAEIILLQLNPGIDNPKGFYDDSDDFVVKNIPGFKKDIYKNLRHTKNKYPFLELNQKYRLYGGFRYWSDKLSPFINSQEDYERLSNKICCIEFFPYHSIKYKGIRKTPLKCQEYNFNLVRMAIRRGALIILMRGKKQWVSNVPQLEKYKYITLKSSRNVILSRANLGKNFDCINHILEN